MSYKCHLYYFMSEEDLKCIVLSIVNVNVVM